MAWEGAELCYYLNGESNCFSLSDIQFAVISKILGLKIDDENNTITCFSDETLAKFMDMNSNPLKLKFK